MRATWAKHMIIPSSTPAGRVTSSQVKTQILALRQAGSVRLDDEETNALAYALDGISSARVVLFGSRVEPHRRGGDVDVLILTDASAYETSKRVATRFYSRCEEKIDVVVLPEKGALPEQQAFIEAIEGMGIS